MKQLVLLVYSCVWFSGFRRFTFSPRNRSQRQIQGLISLSSSLPLLLTSSPSKSNLQQRLFEKGKKAQLSKSTACDFSNSSVYKLSLKMRGFVLGFQLLIFSWIAMVKSLVRAPDTYIWKTNWVFLFCFLGNLIRVCLDFRTCLFSLS